MINGTFSEAYLGTCQTSKIENFAKVIVLNLLKILSNKLSLRSLTGYLKSIPRLGQFLTTEIHLKRMKSIFYFTLKTLFDIEMFKFLS